MECKKCGKTYDVNLVTCPFCGYQDEKKIPHFDNTITTSNADVSSSSPIIIILIILIIASIGYIVYNNKLKKEENEQLLLDHDITMDYKSKGYSFINLKAKSELDGFNLINNDYKYIDYNSEVNSKSFCDLYNINITNENGSLIVSNGEYSKKVNNITNVKYISSYSKKSCECTDFNIVILNNVGKVYIYESAKINYEDEKELIDNIVMNFKEINTNKLIKSIAITSYVGDINPCGEKVLLMLDEESNLLIYRDGKVIDSSAKYSYIIYNVKSYNEVNYSIYINTDRTMILSDNYDSNSPLLKDENDNIVKFVGSFKDKGSDIMYILSTEGLLYKLDLNKNINNSIVEHTSYGIVDNIAYKFDPHSNTMTYVFLFSGESKTEFNGDFETHGVFSVR